MRSKLTDTVVRGLVAPAAGRVTVWDVIVPRLGLRVTKDDTKSWAVKYRLNGRARWYTIGTYPLISLADARAKAKEALAKVVQGEDPAAERAAAKEAVTFTELVADYLEKHARLKKRSWKADERMVKNHVPASWNRALARDISRRQVREVLDCVAKTKPIAANRLLACLRKLFNFGIDRELVETNPCTRIAKPGAENQRDRVLSADELRRLWPALDGEDVRDAGPILKVMLWTAQRGGEVKAMRWTDVDLENGLWIVPATTSKNKLSHRVPLSAPVVAFLRERHGVAVSPFVFPSRRAAEGRRANIAKAVASIRKVSGVDFVPHDLRRTVATFLRSELGVSRLVVAKLLNHVETGITKVYDRASYDREKQAALVSWAARLEQIVSGARAKVLPFARA